MYGGSRQRPCPSEFTRGNREAVKVAGRLTPAFVKYWVVQRWCGHVSRNQDIRFNLDCAEFLIDFKALSFGFGPHCNQRWFNYFRFCVSGDLRCQPRLYISTSTSDNPVFGNLSPCTSVGGKLLPHGCTCTRFQIYGHPILIPQLKVPHQHPIELTTKPIQLISVLIPAQRKLQLFAELRARPVFSFSMNFASDGSPKINSQLFPLRICSLCWHWKSGGHGLFGFFDGQSNCLIGKISMFWVG
jgi:hypothetical protein